MFTKVNGCNCVLWNLGIGGMVYINFVLVGGMIEEYFLATQDKSIGFHQLFMIESSSPMCCGRECLRDAYCESFAFDPVLQKCTGFSGKCVTTPTLLNDYSNYYEIKAKQYCNPCWNYFSGNCFYFSNVTANWYTSSGDCANMNAHLAMITSAEENDKVVFLARDRIMPSSDGFWLGGTDESVEGVWIWTSTGENFTYTNWATEYGEPNNFKDLEHCVEILKYTDFKWNDQVCSWESRQFICEKSQLSI